VVLLLHCMQILSSPDGKVGEPNCVLVIWDFLLSPFIPVLCMYISLKLLRNLPLYFLYYIPPPHTSCLPTVTHLFSQVQTPSGIITITQQDENQQETLQILELYMTNKQLGSTTFPSGSLTVAYTA